MVSEARRAQIHVREVGGAWFGLACTERGLVATSVGPTRERALDSLRRSLPSGLPSRVAEGTPAPTVEKTIALLAALEAGREEGKDYALDAEVVDESLATILRVAATIPLGCVTTYGDVARVAEAEARDVGTAMARNPIYPIVPCHRVVGAGFALVGYAGSRGEAALRAKLGRLTKEARGFREERDVPVEGRSPLRVYPVERAIAEAGRRGLGEARQRSLFE
jgi:methylated-DNA-[protein]-cysteine S-methyltransferase